MMTELPNSESIQSPMGEGIPAAERHQSIINPAALEKLEYSRILERLANECRFSVAAEDARRLVPMTEDWSVVRLMAITAEAVELITEFPEITVGGSRDIRQVIERASKGSQLVPAEFLDIFETIDASRTLRGAIHRASGTEVRFPLIDGFAEALCDLPETELLISRAISPSGDVLDSASEALRRLRSDLRVAHNRLMDRLNSLVSGSKFAGFLQDSIVTSRDGRYVIPVKSESRGNVPGVVHDTSSSGQTLFVEPLEVVDLNNRWREIQIEERREVERILMMLSALVGEQSEPMSAMIDALAEIDLAIAKARLAFRMKATMPILRTRLDAIADGQSDQSVVLIRARHPLLDPALAVPISIEIGNAFHVLLITGPNTGGKTVALKTVGLLAMMAQTGLFIPADDQSALSVFPSLFVDIGDEQSIQQSLSTFSAHMRHVVTMLEEVDEQSLVLLDELGAGTDPQEGSALARAIIQELLIRGPLVLATTHYSEVKAFAYETRGVENASVEFDLATLAPTYRLTVGIPGQSNAVAIAGRLGMPETVLQRARSMVRPDELRSDRLIEQILKRRDETEASFQRISDMETTVSQRLSEIEELQRAAAHERQIARQETLTQAESELEVVRQLLRRLERSVESKSKSAQEISEIQSELAGAEQVARNLRTRLRDAAPAVPAEQFRIGDSVRVRGLGLDGEILSIDSDGAEIAMGGLRMRQPLVSLMRSTTPTPQQRAPVSYRRSSGPTVPLELDLRGERAADIESILEPYLDSAIHSGMPFVRIIHGKGSGALRQEVRRLLKDHPSVSDAHHAEPAQGGDGVTIVRFGD